MTRNELVKMGLTEEVAGQVLDLHQEAIKDMIPRSRFNEVNEANKSLKEQLRKRDSQMESLKKEAGESEKLQAKISELMESNKAASEEYENKISQLRLEHAVESALTSARAKNIKAVKALLELNDAEVDDKGLVKGLDRQLKKLKEAEETAFLFDIKKDVEQPSVSNQENAGKPSAIGVSGMKPSNPDNHGGNGNVSVGASFASRYNNSMMPTNSVNNSNVAAGTNAAM